MRGKKPTFESYHVTDVGKISKSGLEFYLHLKLTQNIEKKCVI